VQLYQDHKLTIPLEWLITRIKQKVFLEESLAKLFNNKKKTRETPIMLKKESQKMTSQALLHIPSILFNLFQDL